MKRVVLVIACFGALNAFAQIETDRPDFTESPNVVPQGALQVETGFVYEGDKTTLEGGIEIRTSNITLNTTLLRYGITDKIELRLNYWANRYKVEELISPIINPCPDYLPIKGVSNTFIGIKTNLYKSDRVSIGMLSHLYLPSLRTGDFSKGIGEEIAPEVLIPCTIDITDKFGVAFQYGLTWNGINNDPTTSYTVALGFGLTDALSFYVEPYGYITQGEDVHLVNGGFTYLLNDNLQLDLTGGLGLSEDAPDYFIGCGLSALFLKKE